MPILRILLAAALLAACGPSSTVPETLPAFCEALNEARTARAKRCNTGLTVEPCDGPTWNLAYEREAKGRIRYDRQAAVECLSTTHSSCYDGYACDRVLRGAVEPGGACSVLEECTGDGRCSWDGACPGICQPLAHEGERCTDDGCEEGTYCERERCVRYAGEGQSCKAPVSVPVAWAGPDSSPRYCADGFECIENRCARPVELEPLPVVGAGKPCSDPEGFEAIAACADGYHCDRATDVCVERGDVEDDCPSPDLWRNTCKPGLYCHNRKCTPPAAEGDACANEGAPCAGGATSCWEGRCRPFPRLGERCEPGGPSCLHLVWDPVNSFSRWIHTFCAEGTCVRAAFNGESCDPEDQGTCNGICDGGICYAECEP